MRQFRNNEMLMGCVLALVAGGFVAPGASASEVTCETVVDWEVLANEARNHRAQAEAMLAQLPPDIDAAQDHVDEAGALMDSLSAQLSAADVAYCGEPAEVAAGVVTCEQVQAWESLINEARGEQYFAGDMLFGPHPDAGAAADHLSNMGNLLDALTVFLGAVDVELCGEMEFTPGGTATDSGRRSGDRSDDKRSAPDATHFGAGDVNQDGRTSIEDVMEVFGDWGSCPEGRICNSDRNSDGKVDLADLVQVLINWIET